MLYRALTILVLLAICLPVGIAAAQSTASNYPVYYVQEGDSLWDIAWRFHVTQQELANANGIADADQITVGEPLIIPGLAGITGVLTAENISFGETLRSLSLRYHISEDMLVRLNHLTSPNELYAGYSLVILKQDHPRPAGKRAYLEPGQSLLEVAVLHDANPWSILAQNQETSSASLLPGDVLRLPGEADSGPGALPPPITAVDVSDLIQGQTAEVKVSGSGGLSLSGSLMDHPLNFFSEPVVGYVALQGIHAMAKPGIYPLTMTGSLSDNAPFSFSQDVLVTAGSFIYDQPLSVDPTTLDPAITGPEDVQWMGLASQVSSDKLWQGSFGLPVEPVFAECHSSMFGSRRSYNGGPYDFYHSGLDYCGQIGDPIYAAAPGVVVFTGLLTVRGNATMIDHGHGVFTAYMHQSEILVSVGDRVEQGQLIGRVGNTGRVEGPHLHFEVLVGDVQVNPLDWLEQVYP